MNKLQDLLRIARFRLKKAGFVVEACDCCTVETAAEKLLAGKGHDWVVLLPKALQSRIVGAFGKKDSLAVADKAAFSVVRRAAKAGSVKKLALVPVGWEIDKEKERIYGRLKLKVLGQPLPEEEMPPMPPEEGLEEGAEVPPMGAEEEVPEDIPTPPPEGGAPGSAEAFSDTLNQFQEVVENMPVEQAVDLLEEVVSSIGGPREKRQEILRKVGRTLRRSQAPTIDEFQQAVKDTMTFIKEEVPADQAIQLLEEGISGNVEGIQEMKEDLPTPSKEEGKEEEPPVEEEPPKEEKEEEEEEKEETASLKGGGKGKEKDPTAVEKVPEKGVLQKERDKVERKGTHRFLDALTHLKKTGEYNPITDVDLKPKFGTDPEKAWEKGEGKPTATPTKAEEKAKISPSAPIFADEVSKRGSAKRMMEVMALLDDMVDKKVIVPEEKPAHRDQLLNMESPEFAKFTTLIRQTKKTASAEGQPVLVDSQSQYVNLEGMFT